MLMQVFYSAIVRVHSVYFDECRLRRQVTANPQTKPTVFGCESTCRLLPSTPTVAIYCYYSAQRLIIILLSHRG